MRNKKGISLIVLIVTIIVIIILAAVVILTLSKNNPIESAKEARFKEDVRTFQDELAMTVSKQYTAAGGHRDTKISTSDFDEIKEYIPSFSEKYRDKFIIQDDELKYTNKLDDNEKEYAQSINVREKNKLLPDEYQQVEYIESTGTQYIDTGLLSKNYPDIFVEINGNFTKIDNSYIFGAGFHNDYNTNCSWKLIGIGKSPFGFVAQNGISGKEQVIMAADKQEHIFILDTVSNIGRIDQNSQVLDNNGVKPINFNYLLFAINNNGIIDRKSSFKMNSCKILENNQLIRYYIPCYSVTNVINSNSNSVPANTKGLYDLVEGKFYTNQNTSGNDFTVGPDVD